MSLHSDIQDAVIRLTREGGVFTEIDVVNEAASGAGWSTKQFKGALTQAGSRLRGEYSEGILVRYGPVELPNGVRDYGRIATKIVYGGSKLGPKRWITPNGTFPALKVDDDDMAGKPGRKSGGDRDDTQLWSEQNLGNGKTVKVSEPDLDGVDVRPILARNEQLQSAAHEQEAEIGRLLDQLEKRDEEIEKLRNPNPNVNGDNGREAVLRKELIEKVREADSLREEVASLRFDLKQATGGAVIERPAADPVAEALATALVPHLMPLLVPKVIDAIGDDIKLTDEQITAKVMEAFAERLLS